MKLAMLLPLLFLTVCAQAQTPISKSLVIKPGQKLHMNFDYPDLIKVKTWDKNEIRIEGVVSINGGESDDAFELITEAETNLVSIRSRINDMKNLPQRIMVIKDGKKVILRNKQEYKKYKELTGGEFDVMSYGEEFEIQLEITVPNGMETRIESIYGMVEINEFEGPLTVVATYGGVDASLTEKNIGELEAETHYGQIYSDLDAKLLGSGIERDFYTHVSARLGQGPQYNFESKYGNVYLRKRKNN
jgi:hypothetical protein